MMTRWHASFSWQRHATSLLLAVLFAASYAKTEEEPAVITQTMAVNYLSQFGYLKPLNPTSGGILSEDSVSSAISDFQAFAGLNITGELDPETARQMTLPRCGVKDKVGPGSGRSKRFALQGSRWRVKKLTYKISKYPKNLAPRKVDEELKKAFQVWADYTDLTFTAKKSGQVHIEIRFETGEHGDGDPFDGPGGTLAHAYFPVYGGDAHFDDAEYWTIGSVRGTNLFQVAAHEFGHSLGLSHSDEKSALMAPFYRGYQPGFRLDDDDISAIQTLYGSKSVASPSYPGRRPSTTPSTPSSEEDPILCTDPKADTMFNSAEGTTYVFKGDHYWRLTLDGVAAGYPKLISRSWQGLPGNIDAAFTYKNGKTYFFKGSKYWRYVGKRMDGDYPKEISEGFTGIPDNIDAVTVWTGNGNIYFYKGSKFWRFDPNQKPPVKNTYPKLISNWEGVPDNLDAALSYRGYTYFFKGNAYYRFQDRTFSVDSADPAFPRSIAYWWFGCRSANKGTLGNIQWLKESPESTFRDNGNLGFADGDFDGQYDRSDDVDDIILDAGETDEQMVTSSNQDAGSAAGGSAFESTAGNQQLALTFLTIIVARFIAAT